MQLLGRATAVVAVTAAVVAGAGLPTAAVAGAEALAPVRVGAAPAVPAGSVRTAAPSGDTKLDLSITLQPRNPGELQGFINAVSNPASPEYRHYLGTGEFGQRFGADPVTVAKMKQALKGKGLTPGEIGANGLTFNFSSTVAQAEKAFSTHFTGYRLADGSTGFANTEAPALSGELAGSVAAIVGLDTTVRLQPRNVRKKTVPLLNSSVGNGDQPQNIGASPKLCPGWVSTMVDAGYTDGTDYYSSGALATAYDLNGLADGASGSTVAILSLENYDSRAVANYQSCNGTKTTVSKIRVSGTEAPPDVDNGEGGETALDVETVASLAPGASILVYQGENSGTGVLGTYQRIADDNRAQVLSVSWGRCEAERTDSRLQALNLTLQQAAAQGQSVVVASGDSGSTGCYSSPVAGNDVLLNVDDPASQPYATGIGGTSHSGLGKFPGPVEVWNDGYGAGGGGVSTGWKLSDTAFPWNATHAPGYTNACGAAAGQTCRQVPDVSALSDPYHGYLVFTHVDSDNVTHGAVIGGTSAAAPLWAALIADANTSLGCAANGPVGYLNPALHRLAGNTSVFTDVTVGDNNLTISGNTDGKYQAATGYDLATGLGAPKGRGVIDALCQGLPEQPAGTFNPVQPDRLLDTRPGGVGSTGAKLAGRATKSLLVAGRGGVPASGVTAVVLNVTVTRTEAPGFLTAWPSGKAQPTSSNLNWAAGSDVPNLVTVPLGGDGKVNLFNGSAAPTDLVVDVFGYYKADTTGSTLTPAGPARLLDTRDGTGAAKAQVGSRQTLDLKIAGVSGLPASGITAVVLNTTVTGGRSGGYLTAWPSDKPQPSSSNLNWVANQTVPNLVIVPVSADGRVRFFNGSPAPVDIVADVFGYFTKSTSGGRFHNAGPKRLMDTRSGLGAPAPAALTNGQVVHLALDRGVLAGATSVVLNVTVTATTGPGYLNAWPGYTTRPGSSNLNWSGGQTIANLVTVPVRNGAVDLAVSSPGTAHVVVDLFGYYSS